MRNTKAKLQNCLLYLSILIVANMLIPAASYASTILLKSDESANVDIIIEPGDGSVFRSDTQIRRLLKPGQTQKIVITKDQMNNAETFTITGKVKMPSIYNRCGPLFIDRDYKIVFTGSKTGGTICVAEEDIRR